MSSWRFIVLVMIAWTLTDTPLWRGGVRERRSSRGMSARGPDDRLASACAGERPPLPDVLLYELHGGAFPGSGRPDVAVHVPPGFDATRRPGLVLYFHGWNGCVATALGDEDAPCTVEGAARPASGLAAQIDGAGVNALLVAIELRADMPTGETGQLAMPGGLRGLLRELFEEHLHAALGCVLDVDELDRVVVVAHSGGYQAAASVLEYGDMPQITEVDLLDALYGAQEVFSDWMQADIGRFDPRVDSSLRFVDLYTLGGGTFDRSRAMASFAAATAEEAGLGGLVYDDDGEADLDEAELAGDSGGPHAIIFKRSPRDHVELPRSYVRALVQAAGFSRVAGVLARAQGTRRPAAFVETSPP